MSVPHLSVLMTTYNGERFLNAAIVSILEQTFTDFEFIIVDDGSMDGSASIIRSFSRRDSRVRGIFLRKNVGIPRAANRGLREVRAALVGRMDSDDLCAADRFARQVSYMDEHADIYMLGCRSVNIDEHGDRIKDGEYNIDFARGRKMIGYLMGKGIYPLLHATLVYRTASVLALGGYREIFSIGEDIDLCKRMLSCYGSVFANLGNKLYFYRRHSSSSTQVNDLLEHSLVQTLIQYSFECRVRGLPDPLADPLAAPLVAPLADHLADARELSFSSLAISASERKKLEHRCFIISVRELSANKEQRRRFLARFDRSLSHEPQHPQGCLPCIVVARECLRYGEYIYFMRYLLRAFRIDFILTSHFFYTRTLSRLGK